ncbi:hypothetical protein [Nocardioides daeguensis]|uniref:Peptidase MA-like domain-containing protein n=1 Tax=Nocardioides daeguensis TaxID=908359 RepID=A0ABP6UTZ0_9ACTN|nr:hypothetical protein [Nocardioides daeguensis]MBV6725755.1 hypothetical protein [Nocardioides daeguensis]MCR1772730.1 hypothetical protein [Nocardioides daeguensis]
MAGGCSKDDYVAPPPATTSEVADPAAAADTLAALQAAVRDGDRPAAADLGADAEVRDLLTALVANAEALGLTDVTLRYLTETGRTDGADGWDGQVALTWRIEGNDEASARTELPVSFAAHGAAIAAIGGTGTRLPLWLSGPLSVERDGDVVVAVAGDPTGAREYLASARRAVAQVRAVVPGPGGLVVEVPADPDGLRRTLDTEPGQYDAIAAVTAPVDGSQAPGSPVHVFLNRAVYDDLDPVAAQVVMTHEAVHALTGAVGARQAPLWLVEGFADYVALRDVDLPLTRTAGQVAAQVRKDGVPTALPADGDFNPSASHLGGVYESAWLVCVTLADHGGERALVDLYEQVRGGEDLAAVLRQHQGWSVAELTAAWQDRLRALPGVAG